jgi:hypothetical protein
LSSYYINLKKEKKLQYKAIVSDLDGTLLNTKGQLSDYTLATLNTLSERGIEIVLATGRHPKDAQNITRLLGRNVSIVGLNGALALCNQSGKVIDEHRINATSIAKVMSLIQDNNVHINIFDSEGWKIYEVNQMAEDYTKFSGFPYIVVPSNMVPGLNINKILLWKADGIAPIEKMLKNKMGDKLEYYRTSEQQIEISPPNVSKASAVITLLAKKGISFQHQAIAFGDGLNDLQMLSQAAQGVVMHNAMPELREELNTLPVAPCNASNGVARYIQQIFDI